MHNLGKGLTTSSDWDAYYCNRDPRQQIPEHLHLLLDKEILCRTPAKIFELGCGFSPVLIECAHHEWEVSGIDFHTEIIERLTTFLLTKSKKIGSLIAADALSFDIDILECQFDLLVSFGFLEHFENPEIVLKKWVPILRQGGIILSSIPNLSSLNGTLLKYLDPSLWSKHLLITPGMLDNIHQEAGLKVLVPASYAGRFEIDMLIPWDALRKLCTIKFCYKLMRYVGSFLIEPVAKLAFDWNRKATCPIIYGLYQKF